MNKSMNRSRFPHFYKAAGMGLLSGIRTMAGPAMLAPLLTPRGRRFPFFKPAKAHASARILKGLTVMEMLVDKLPIAPRRTAAAPLLGRTVAGACAGALTCRALGRTGRSDMLVGGLAGALAAMAGAFAAFHIRRRITRSEKVPDFVVGLVEDAAVMGLGRKILSNAA